MNEREIQNRAYGCFMGQLIGDALGSQVEGWTSREIMSYYGPQGCNIMEDGGTWGTAAGQPTDDSEMALTLARCIIREGFYHPLIVLHNYGKWLNSDPFDVGSTVYAGLKGNHRLDSKSNGATMRISPLGIIGVNYTDRQLINMAKHETWLTHRNRVCMDVNNLFVPAITSAILGRSSWTIHDSMVYDCHRLNICEEVVDCVERSRTFPPKDYISNQGYVLVAFGNALHHMLHANSFYDAMISTIEYGGDTDTNAAICGALVGAVHGYNFIPDQWKKTVLNCKPDSYKGRAQQPRPREYWPCDALEIVDALLKVGKTKDWIELQNLEEYEQWSN